MRVADVGQLIQELAQDHAARLDVPESVRFAEVRSQLRSFPKEEAANWPALYKRAYSAAVTEQIRAELMLEDQIQDDALALLLLVEA
jgi:hypothetical protein